LEKDDKLSRINARPQYYLEFIWLRVFSYRYIENLSEGKVTN